MNAEFQRIARRDKKAFLSDRCKEIEENNRMGITRDLFKKTRDTKVTFHAKMDSIKDRNDMDPTETEDIKKRWQEHTEGWSWDGWAPGSALQALSSPLRPSSQGGATVHRVAKSLDVTKNVFGETNAREGLVSCGDYRCCSQ